MVHRNEKKKRVYSGWFDVPFESGLVFVVKSTGPFLLWPSLGLEFLRAGGTLPYAALGMLSLSTITPLCPLPTLQGAC